MAGRGVGTRAGGGVVRGVDGDWRSGAHLRVRSVSSDPGRRRAMRPPPDCWALGCLGGRSPAEIAWHAGVQVREAEMQEPGNAAAEDGGDADLGFADGPPCCARARDARQDSNHHQDRDCKTADGRCTRPPVESPADLRAQRQTGPVGWRLERIMDRGRALAPEIIRARRRLLGTFGRGSGSEGDELLARAKPVPGEANHVGPRASLLLSCLGMSAFLHPVGDLFQRFLRRRRSCRHERAVV